MTAALPPGFKPIAQPGLPPGFKPMQPEDANIYSLLPEHREATINAVAEGKIDTPTLYRNTMTELEKRYGGPAQELFEPNEQGGQWPMGLVSAPHKRTGARESVNVEVALEDIQKAVQERLQTEARSQAPEGLGVRALAGLKVSDTGVGNFLRAKYPKADIIPEVVNNEATGNFIIREPGKPARFLRDAGGTDFEPLADLADVSADVVRAGVAAPVVAAATPSTLGIGTAPAIALGGVAGEAAAQGISAALPGADELSLTDRAKMGAINVGTELAGAGAGALIGAAGRGAVRRLLPRSTRAAEALAPTVMKPGQAAGEGVVRDELARTATGAAHVFDNDIKEIGALHEHIGKIIESPMGAREATQRTAAAYKTLTDKAYKLRAKVGAEKFGEVDRLAGGKPLFKLEKTVSAIDGLVAGLRESTVPGDAITVKKLLAIKKKIAADGLHTTAKGLQNSLSGWGAAAKGSGDVFKEIAASRSKKESRRMAAAIFSALEEDLDVAAKRFGPIGEVGKALQDARGSYKALSAAIDAQRNELLDKALKSVKAGRAETFPQKLLSPSALGDEQLKKTLGVVRSIDPEAADALSKSALETLVGRAGPKASSKLGEAGALIQPSKLVDADAKFATRIQALFEGNPAGYASWKKAIETAKRLAKQPGKGPPEETWFGGLMRSPWFKLGGATGAGAMGAAGIMGGVSGTTAATAAGGFVLYKGVKMLANRLDEKRLIQLLAEPESARLFLGLVEPKPGMTAKQASQAVQRLLALTASPDRESDQ